MHTTWFALALLVWEFLVHGSWAFRLPEGNGWLAAPSLNLAAFLESAALLAPQGHVAGMLALNLEQGVTNTTSSSSFTTEADGTLKLVVEHSRVNQGEIATPSKVPVQWTLEIETTYRFRMEDNGRWRLYVTGLKLLPFDEGLEMYHASGAAEKCGQKADIVNQAVCERKELYKWYTSQWKQFKKSEYRSKPAHKLARILYGMYGTSATFYGIKAGGRGAWEKILYAFVTIPAVEIDFFEFASNSEDPDEVEIAMSSHEVFSGTYGTLDLASFNGLNFKAKNGAEFQKDAWASQRLLAERMARSGINFGAMSAKGRDDIINDDQVRGGTAKYILKFASPCTESETDKTDDPTVACKGDHGRVHWK